MQRFGQYTPLQEDFLIESDSSEATNQEMVICFVYNVKKIAPNRNPFTIAKDSNEIKTQALRAGGIDEKKFDSAINKSKKDKFGKSTMILVAKKVVESMGDRGKWLVHAGASNSKTYYELGSDTTSKADFTGNDHNYISLKKAGDNGSGAQLMSAKSGEASGVVVSAIEHYSKNEGRKITKNANYKNAINILEHEMLKTARNDLNVEVAKGKKDFQIWYSTQSDRVQQLKLKGSEKQIVDHLKAELSLLGATKKTKNASKNLISGVSPITKDELEDVFNDYIASTSKIGDVKVSAKHLKNVDPKKLEASELKTQIVDVVRTAMATPEWKEELTKFFTDNQELKKWIVYEAGSGLYKFTGTISGGKNYYGENSSVANRILVFYEDGIKKEHDIFTWAMDNAQLVNKIDISYKGSGRAKYIKFGLSDSVEYELPTLYEEIDAIENEYLTEGMFGNIKKKMGNVVKKIQNAVKKFYERVIKRFVKKLRMVTEQGITKFMDFVGLEIQAKMTLATPRW